MSLGQLRLYAMEDIRLVNELRMRARRKLGAALAKVERARGNNGSRSQTLKRGYRELLHDLKVDIKIILHAQRIGTMPDTELEKTFAMARKEERLLHYTDLIVIARPNGTRRAAR